MDARSPAVSDCPNKDTVKMVRACAGACEVAEELVEKIVPASPEQEHRMNHHIETGSYMMQMVLHYEGDMNISFLIRVLSVMCAKNHILRTRLVRYGGKTYQVVLGDSIVFQTASNMYGYLAQNHQARMSYGSPLLRYAFIREACGENFFVWTVHCSAVDSWTLRLMFDDLQTGCSDLATYSETNSRPPYGKYVKWISSLDYKAESAFWLKRHTNFDNITHKFPTLGLGGTPSRSTLRTRDLLLLPEVERTEFNLYAMGYAAWTLTIAKYLTQANRTLVDEEISFISTSSARKIDSNPRIADMMGPISARVPLRIRVFSTLSIENLMRDIEIQVSSMIRHENYAMQALSTDGCFKNLPKQAVFSWNPPDSDLSSKRIACHDKEAAPTVLAYREDLSVPFIHDYGLMYDIYEHEDYLIIYASWDHGLVSTDLVSQLVKDFGKFLTSIIKRPTETVGELMFAHNTGSMVKTDNER